MFLPLSFLGVKIFKRMTKWQKSVSMEKIFFGFKRVLKYSESIPKKIFFVNEIPKGSTGKLQRIGLAKKFGME